MFIRKMMMMIIHFYVYLPINRTIEYLGLQIRDSTVAQSCLDSLSHDEIAMFKSFCSQIRAHFMGL